MTEQQKNDWAERIDSLGGLPEQKPVPAIGELKQKLFETQLEIYKTPSEIEQFNYDELYKSWVATGDDNQKLMEHLRAIIQAWEEDEDIVINTGRKIREAQEYLYSRNSSKTEPIGDEGSRAKK